MNEINHIIKYILNNRILRHVFFWIFIVSYFTWGFGFTGEIKKSFFSALAFLPGHFLVVYPLLYFLIPKLLVKRRFILFFLCFALLLIACALFVSLLQLSVHNYDKFQGFNLKIGKNVMPFVHVGALAASIKLIKYSYFQEKQAADALHQKTLAELELLKSQIHPHFLFNTLNNLFAHTIRKSNESPEIVLKLSELLRFMIYESKANLIPLAEEIQLLKNYIDLEKMRYNELLEISFTCSGDISKKYIAPLLLLPMVENSFKHGASKQIGERWITLDISVRGDDLFFKLANSKDQTMAHQSNPRQGGIGLENVKRRLELLYPGEYSLEISNEESFYLVHLTLRLAGQNSPTTSTKTLPTPITHDLELPVG